MADRQAMTQRAQGAQPPFQAYLDAGEKRGLLWTPLRRRVLDLFWQEPVAWGAYGATRRLLRDGRTHPNSVYRALRALEAVGLIAPIHSLKRHLIAPDPGRTAWSALICADCGNAILRPVPPQADAILRLAATHGFTVRDLVIECLGRCGNCANGNGAGR